MDATYKKSRSILSSKFFPTNEELAELAETGQWEELAKATKLRNAENAILQAREREPIFTNKDVIRLTLLHADIRDILNASSKVPLIAIILKEKGFWKEKLQIDMPELFMFDVWNTLEIDYGITKLYFDNEDVTKERGVYMVFRYITRAIKRYIFYTTDSFFYPTLDKSLKVTFNELIPKSDFLERTAEMNGIRMGKPVHVTFFTYYQDMFKRPGVQYLHNFLNDTRPTRMSSTWYGVASAFFWKQYHDPTKKFIHTKDSQKQYNIMQLFNQGYYKKDGRDRIVIGSENICDYCQEKPISLKMDCCQQFVYCSEECAKQGWDIHKKECFL